MHHIDQQTILHSDVVTSVCFFFSIIIFSLALVHIRKKSNLRYSSDLLGTKKKQNSNAEVQLSDLGISLIK